MNFWFLLHMLQFILSLLVCYVTFHASVVVKKKKKKKSRKTIKCVKQFGSRFKTNGVGPNLDPKCLQRLSVDNKSCCLQGKS